MKKPFSKERLTRDAGKRKPKTELEMTDDINDVSHTSTLAKFEESVRRSSPDSTTGPITREEMMELFGDYMPIEAVSLVWDAPGDMTLGEIRSELRKLAKARPTDAAARTSEPVLSGLHEDLILMSFHNAPTVATPTERASDYAELVRELHQAAEEHDRGHGPLHAAAANAIDHLMTLIRLMRPGSLAQPVTRPHRGTHEKS